MKARSIFIGGTASHAGKSWMTTAVCRYLRRRGLRVAPFKAQNMSNNSYPCADGGEIGRAQVAQAEACGLEPLSDMNPILLKPNSNTGSQVVLNGKVWKNLSARDYYEQFPFLFGRVLEAFDRLSSRFDCIVMEGAGSVAEINLKSRDLVNLRLAQRVGARALLVADIDRGGVFASVVGTMCLLDPEERQLVRSFAVNRFRGDPALFEDGVQMLRDRTGIPCLGVFPMLEDTSIDAEDGVWLDGASPAAEGRIAAIRFPRISNLTDLQRIAQLDWIAWPSRRLYDCVILPGTKSTIADLQWMRSRGIDVWIKRQHAAGAAVVGICGGYQMLGRSIEDPDQVEGGGCAEGLDLLPVSTVLLPEKTTRRVNATLPSGAQFPAYEIHMGETTRPADAVPFAYLDSGAEGIRHNRTIGTYLHGALEHAAVASEVLGIEQCERPSKEAAYDALADWFEANADTRLFEEMYL